jgi:hypothetical protein
MKRETVRVARVTATAAKRVKARNRVMATEKTWAMATVTRVAGNKKGSGKRQQLTKQWQW